MNRLNKLLKKKRLENNLSQAKVAQELNLDHYQYISNLERNKCTLSRKYFNKISKLYGIKTEQLIKLYLKDIEDKTRSIINGR